MKHLTIIIGLCIVILFCFVSPVNAECSIVGQWTRTGGIQGTWNYYEDGSATYGNEPGFPGFVGTATWVSNGGGSYTTYWNHGYDDLLRWIGYSNPPDYPNYIDYITMAGDCNSFTLVNNVGDSAGGVRSQPLNCKVEVLKTDVDLPKTKIPADWHTRIFYTNPYGQLETYEGQAGPLVSACSKTGFQTGQKLTAYHVDGSDNYKYYDPRTVKEGADVCGINKCFGDVRDVINNNYNICYNIKGPNSNTVAYTMLSKCGLNPNIYNWWEKPMGWGPFTGKFKQL
jgi:hypothetical protein